MMIMMIYNKNKIFQKIIKQLNQFKMNNKKKNKIINKSKV